jgi:hypothetical protein
MFWSVVFFANQGGMVEHGSKFQVFRSELACRHYLDRSPAKLDARKQLLSCRKGLDRTLNQSKYSKLPSFLMRDAES